jgi:hypothetical protein
MTMFPPLYTAEYMLSMAPGDTRLVYMSPKWHYIRTRNRRKMEYVSIVFLFRNNTKHDTCHNETHKKRNDGDMTTFSPIEW